MAPAATTAVVLSTSKSASMIFVAASITQHSTIVLVTPAW